MLLHVTKTDFYDLKDGCPEAPVLLFDFGYFGFNFSVFFYSRFFFTFLFLVIFFWLRLPEKKRFLIVFGEWGHLYKKKKIIRNYLLFWSFSHGCYNLVWSIIYRPFFSFPKTDPRQLPPIQYFRHTETLSRFFVSPWQRDIRHAWYWHINI